MASVVQSAKDLPTLLPAHPDCDTKVSGTRIEI